MLVQALHSLHPSLASPSKPPPARRRSPPETGSFTDREPEVLCLMAQGHGSLQMSPRLTISEATLRTHVSNILAKLNLCSRTQSAL